MPDWLRDSFVCGSDMDVLLLIVRLSVAFVLGCVVAGIYRLTQGRPGNPSLGLMATLALLTVLISMVTLVIGNRANSVALAFSLVGALSIVRFRTVVEDTRDTAFVIFAVAVGMGVGSGYLTISLVSIPFVALAAFLFRPRADAALGPPRDYTLTVRLGLGHAPEALLREAFGKHLEHARLTATARQRAALNLTYSVRLRHDDGAITLVTELNGLDGVQEVELRQA